MQTEPLSGSGQRPDRMTEKLEGRNLHRRSSTKAEQTLLLLPNGSRGSLELLGSCSSRASDWLHPEASIELPLGPREQSGLLRPLFLGKLLLDQKLSNGELANKQSALLFHLEPVVGASN